MDHSLVMVLTPILGILVSVILGWIGSSISDLSKHVRSLNDKMILIVDKVNSHESRIAKLESRRKR